LPPLVSKLVSQTPNAQLCVTEHEEGRGKDRKMEGNIKPTEEEKKTRMRVREKEGRKVYR
jgi:hypothetical protein